MSPYVRKYIGIGLMGILSLLESSAQKPNWQNLDLERDSVFGISTEKAYSEILAHKKKFQTVIVGVIDSGVDTAHEDLKNIIWSNPRETYNGVDDDHDGYTDDMHGWNFIGGKHGNVKDENLELVRMIRAGRADSAMIADYNTLVKRDQDIIENVEGFEKVLDGIVLKIGKTTPTIDDFKSYKPADSPETQVREQMIINLQGAAGYNEYRNTRLKEYYDHFKNDLDYSLNLHYNSREIVGDDTANATEHFYGNADVSGPTDFHGTHVAGIIAAVRDNGIGIQGVANHVWIMSIRTVPDGDERDKDVANAIRFAADHGARVINMSFGKSWSPDKRVVDDAVRYAMSKDVLLIHGSGNDGLNLDHEKVYPSRVYADSSGTAQAWIEVGASTAQNDSTLVATFSNYGKHSVDVFAPGVDIYSCIPGSKYTTESGTSMAAPMVTGLAALIREYYPKLTAVEVKQIIMESVTKPTQRIYVRDNGKPQHIYFSETCISGGIVNAYYALLMAEKYRRR